MLRTVIGADVTMSSIKPCINPHCFNGSKVIDGIYAPIDMHERTSMAHTRTENNPWIQIKLYQKFCVSAVKIWNRNLDVEGRHAQSK